MSRLLGNLGADLAAVGLIARRELRAYFATFSGYMILAAHLLVSGLLFNVYAVGSSPKYSQEVLEGFFYFSSGMAIVTAVLLAMRLLAEERQLGTLVLLRTAPITERQIVWGKFFSALAFLALTLVLSTYMPALVTLHGKISLPQIVVGYLGLLLLGSACIAITLLASSWSPNQLIAGASAGVMIVILLVVWMLAQVAEPPLKQILSYVALHNIHFTPFSRGTLNLRDLMFYLGLTVFFLEASVQVLASWRWRE